MDNKAANSDEVRVAFIGSGFMARIHLDALLKKFDDTLIPVVCEPSTEQYELTSKLFVEAGREVPKNEPDLEKLLNDYKDELDAAFIITPHVFHHDQAKACLEAGIDVFLEKPMVMNPAEARSLVDVRNRTGRLLVVAFNGSLSPEIRRAATMLRSGELGRVQSISATIWQDWREKTKETWRQVPSLAGGGFLFDTGAHMLNTVADLAGDEFVEVAAWLDNRGTLVDIIGVVLGRLASGALVTMHGSGATVPSCASDIRVFCSKAVIRTGAWGEFLEIQHQGSDSIEEIKLPAVSGAWEQFLAIRRGEMVNPCPPEVGLRMAYLWEAIQVSAAQKGKPVNVNNFKT